jgi:hypothetical protein
MRELVKIKRFSAATILLCSALALTGCDKINNASRTLDTMLGGDFLVYVQGIKEPFVIDDGKVTSVPEKGYYIYYPTIDGQKKLVQSPIQNTTIVEI